MGDPVIAAVINSSATVMVSCLTGTIVWYWQQNRLRTITLVLEKEKLALTGQIERASSLNAQRLDALAVLINATATASTAAARIYSAVGGDKDHVLASVVNQIPLLAIFLEHSQSAQSNLSLTPEDLNLVAAVRDALVTFFFELSFDKRPDSDLEVAFANFNRLCKNLEDRARGEVRIIRQLGGIAALSVG